MVIPAQAGTQGVRNLEALDSRLRGNDGVRLRGNDGLAPASSMRADQLLVERGLASSRSQAQRLIASGVQWLAPGGWKIVGKNGDELPEAVEIELLDAAEARYVSRGGLKLEAALSPQATGLLWFQ